MAQAFLGTTPKQFQILAIENGTTILQNCLSALAKLPQSSRKRDDRRTIISETGVLLFEAPTGSGKTLMAGRVVENLCGGPRSKIIWFWFTPFVGTVDQAIKTIRTEFFSLRPRDPM